MFTTSCKVITDGSSVIRQIYIPELNYQQEETLSLEAAMKHVRLFANSLGIQSYSQLMIGCPFSPPERIVFSFHYHSQKGIGSVGRITVTIHSLVNEFPFELSRYKNIVKSGPLQKQLVCCYNRLPSKMVLKI